SRFAISCLLLLCATSQPFLTQYAKLTLVSNLEQFLFFRHRRKKMILGGTLFAKLSRRVYRGVDLPTQFRLNLSPCRNHIGETYLAHYHHINVPTRLFLPSCHPPLHQPNPNPILN